jgi:hypothetical protein
MLPPSGSVSGTATRRDDQGCGHSQPRSRSLRSLVRRLLVAYVVKIGVAVPFVGVARALCLDSSTQLSAEQVPTQLPSWTAADQRAHPRCVPSASLPRGRPSDFIVVYSFRDQVRRRVAFADAWTRNHNHTEVDDVGVVGICPGKAVRIAQSPRAHR